MGGTFLGLLQILFIALKLTHVISWPWLLVLTPIWIPFSFWVLVVTMAFILVFFVAAVKAL